MDSLSARLEVQCCSTQAGNIDYFNVMLEADHVGHAIPEPSAFLILSAGLVTFACIRRRRSCEETPMLVIGYFHA